MKRGLQKMKISRALKKIRGGFHKAIYALSLKFVLCDHPFRTNLLWFGILQLRLVLNFLHCLPDFRCALCFTPYALCPTPYAQLLWNPPLKHSSNRSEIHVYISGWISLQPFLDLGKNCYLNQKFNLNQRNS
jgi:hypothetical protein